MRLQYKWWETKSTVLVLCKNPFKSLSESYIRLQLSQWNQVDIVQGYVLFSVKFPLCGIAVGFLAQLLWRDRHFVLKIQIQSIVKSPLDLAMLACWNLISTSETLWNSLTYRWKTVQSCFASCLYSYERHIQSETDTKYCMSVKCEATTCHQNRCNAVSATTLHVSGVYWCDDTAFKRHLAFCSSVQNLTYVFNRLKIWGHYTLQKAGKILLNRIIYLNLGCVLSALRPRIFGQP